MEETIKLGNAKLATNLSSEDVLLRETKTDDELREVGWKKCISCEEMRPPKLFYKSSRRGGLTYTCKLCHRNKVRSYRNVPESYNWWYRRYEKIRNKARKRGLEFTLTMDDYKYLKEQEECYYCKDEMDLATIDRKDNDKGYIIDNVVSCCWMCNKVKSSYFNEEEMLIIGKAIKIYTKRMKKLVSQMQMKEPVLSPQEI